ncbi:MULTISPECIES: phosphatase PAP2 family protein [Aeromonas]|uniref:undecaprenyl-diphosphate phosphatase n=1 Tax=Aeromonas hydrophila TaxID=644 RepID=A0ABD7G9L4_AERHY|nr:MULTISPECIES: phosphatase PAP2 family protein [Aeromonas]AUZ76467.1 phosphatase PAP2 family protein [Aeromonas sp. ASNIH4]MBC8672102.1 phosphatase PAP2 family protein [Aeromonas hydrophila]MBC8689603.1 phosphatase PAP2 family protein [Aeromonas hydrophila]POU34790.1 phosphatase PAP2 family protein [Aeromonas hydrophila]POV86413.1 phosphatase PAP2 family protein [Aeromonas sp. ASNIH6]
MNKIQQWDLQVCRICLLHAYNRPQARISRLISRTGDGPLYAVLAALLWWQGEAERELVTLALLAFAFELPLYLLLKNLLKRQRPAGLPVFITPSDRYSLPSGHTAAAFLMATVLAASFPLWAPLLFVWAALVGASRLLLGVHYLSDLVAGALLGGGCALLALGWGQ